MSLLHRHELSINLQKKKRYGEIYFYKEQFGKVDNIQRKIVKVELIVLLNLRNIIEDGHPAEVKSFLYRSFIVSMLPQP